MNTTSRSLGKVVLLGFLALTVLGCGDDAPDDDGRPDSVVVDAGDAAFEDASGGDASEGLPTTCEGACADHALAVAIGGESGEFERAFYGLTSPEVAESGQWEVYIEAAQGGDDACPQQDSPSPDWSLIVSGLAMPLDATPRTKADDGVSVVFFDFDGRFLGQEPFVQATGASITPTAAHLDTDLVGEGSADDDGVVALELEASFAAGEVSGHLVATHCASLDVAAP
jgi:hypothetical protein